MNQNLHFLNYEKHTLPYRRYGNGQELLIAFHGYGRSSEDFSVFEKDLGHAYTIIAFDFFYHGANADELEIQVEPLTTTILSNMLEKLLWEEKKVRFSVIGHSLGGKLALGFVHRLPHRIHELFLLAPDGFTFDIARKFLLNTWLGKQVSKLSVSYPKLFINTIKLGGKIKLYDQKQQHFFLKNIETKDQRLRVYRTWQTLKKFSLHLGLVQHYLNTRSIRFELFFGKYDKIVPQSVTSKFIRKLKQKEVLHLLDCGHQIFQKHEDISRIILQNSSNN